MKKLRLSELSSMTEQELESTCANLAKAARAKPNGELVELDEEIRGYEEHFDIKSDALAAAVDSGKLEETAEVASWFIALDLRQHLVRRQARA